MTDPPYGAFSKNESAVTLSPKKKSSGVFQKTKEALGKVNSKLLNNTRKGDMTDMVPFESDSSFSFDPERDLDGALDSFKSAERQSFEAKSATDCEKKERSSGIVSQEPEEAVDDEETIHIASESPITMITKKYIRNVAKTARSHQPSSSEPTRSTSMGSKSKQKSPTSSFSPRPSSGKPKRHLSVSATGALSGGESAKPSPGSNRKHLATPAHAGLESKTMKGLPQTPPLPTEGNTEESFSTIVKEAAEAETSWKRVSHAFEGDDGAMGGYFAKLIEKMEAEGSPSEADVEESDGHSDKEAQKKTNKFKTPQRFRKFFSLGRSPRDNQFEVQNENSYEEENITDMAMFTAFISSPKASDSPRRSQRKHFQQSSNDGSNSKLEDFPEIPLEKQTRLDDIRKEVNWKRENSSSEQTNPSKTRSSHSRSSTRRSSTNHNTKSSSDGRRASTRDPGSPGKWNSTHRRGSKRENVDKSSSVGDESIPPHSVSNRRSRNLKLTDGESGVNEQLYRSSDRICRTKGCSSRSSSEHPGKPESQKKLEDCPPDMPMPFSEVDKIPSCRRFGDSIEPPTLDESVHRNEKPIASFVEDNSGSRKKRISSGRIDTRGLSSHSSHSRRKRSSGKRRPERSSSDHDNSERSEIITESTSTNHFSSLHELDTSVTNNSEKDQFLLAQNLASEPTFLAISRRTRSSHNPKQALLMRSLSVSNVHKGYLNSREIKKPTSYRINRQTSEIKLRSVSEVDECGGETSDEDFTLMGNKHVGTQIDDALAAERKKKLPSLLESLNRGSELNIRLFDSDGQETVVTDDGSMWFDQGSVSGLEIKSSASVSAPQLLFDQKMTRIVEQG
ncbi:hypothetical protein IV203_001649 [Nitzschia inconspicua]|uniref:Uncharacterized protein n=1 Tax=Nitzschia inconspicua TaxID=303405 RepID=A0A9K3L8Y9_9STRA|nr:hypothetical protein IV203_001649 [Nitzschia inconspicua]